MSDSCATGRRQCVEIGAGRRTADAARHGAPLIAHSFPARKTLDAFIDTRRARPAMTFCWRPPNFNELIVYNSILRRWGTFATVNSPFRIRFGSLHKPAGGRKYTV